MDTNSKYIHPIISALLIVLVLSAYALASDSDSFKLGFGGTPDDKGIPGPWKLKVNKGNAGAAVVTEDGASILHIKCVDSSFSLESELPLSPADYPYVIWTWKAVRLPKAGDVRKKGHDDQALQLLVAFDNKKVLSYVWDSNAPEGTTAREFVMWPFSIEIAVIVVQPGTADTGKWVTDTRNIYEDYKKFFNEQPPRVTGVRIQSNTQHTKDIAEGYVRDIIFSSAPQ
ncbi:MAG: DUF3047 domain-containing protein [Nitrospirae bacterium]|nr:DUF3047 domain-containing protein [Nitrospirota bacterium]